MTENIVERNENWYKYLNVKNLETKKVQAGWTRILEWADKPNTEEGMDKTTFATTESGTIVGNGVFVMRKGSSCRV